VQPRHTPAPQSRVAAITRAGEPKVAQPTNSNADVPAIDQFTDVTASLWQSTPVEFHPYEISAQSPELPPTKYHSTGNKDASKSQRLTPSQHRTRQQRAASELATFLPDPSRECAIEFTSALRLSCKSNLQTPPGKVWVRKIN